MFEQVAASFGAEVAPRQQGPHNAGRPARRADAERTAETGESMVTDRTQSNGAHAPPGADSPPAGANARSATGEPDRLAILLADLGKLGRYARYYVELRLDSLKLTAREALIASVWGLLAAVVGGAALVTGVVLLLVGVSRGVGVLANNDWAGPLVTGMIVLGGAMIAVAALGHQLRQRALVRTQEKYAALRAGEPTAVSVPPTNGVSHERA
jgi:hypothetical protein